MAGSTMEHMELPLPYRMNTDVPSLNSPPGTSEYMYNVLPGSPTHLRPRRGLRSVAMTSRPDEFYNPSGMLYWPGDKAMPEQLFVFSHKLGGLAPGAMSGNPPQYQPDFGASWTPTMDVQYTRIMPPSSDSPSVWTGQTPDPPHSRAIPVGTQYMFGGLVAYPAINEVTATIRLWGGAPLTANGATASGIFTVGSTNVANVSGSPADGALRGMVLSTLSPQSPRYRVADNYTISGVSYIILDRPYGTDAVGPYATTGTKTFGYSPTNIIALGGSCAVFRERLWMVSSTRGSRLEWTVPGVVYSSDANVVEFGVPHVITGLAGLPECLLVWSMDQMWRITGFDNDTFQRDLVSNAVGCIDPGTITYWGDRAYWCGADGVHSSNGYDLKEHTRAGDGTGIAQYYRNALRRMRTGAPTGATVPDSPKFMHILKMWTYQDYLFLTFNNHFQKDADGEIYKPTNEYPTLMMHIPTGSWGLWGIYGPRAGLRRPRVGFSTQYQRMWVADDLLIYDASRIAEVTPNGGPANDSILGDPAVPIEAVVRFNAVTPYGQDTARLHGIQITHNCSHEAPAGVAIWKIAVEADPHTSQATTFSPTGIDDAGELFTRLTVTPDPSLGSTFFTPVTENTFVDRFRNIEWPREGMAFRVTMTSLPTPSSNATNADVLRVALRIDGRPVNDGRVQETP